MLPVSSNMKYPLIRPTIPPVERWSRFLDDSYGAKRFSNFGPLATRLEVLFVENWGEQSTACVLTSSGTAALAAPLIASGLQERTVLLPAFTFPATLSAILMAGLEPVLIDVCPYTWTVDPKVLERAFTYTGARAAVILRPFGLRTNLAEQARIAARHGALLVIDNAAGLGISRDHPEKDPWVFEAYSLHATKPFAVGEGGAVFAHRTAETGLRRAINFGLPESSDTHRPRWGINGKMSEFQAAVGLAVAETFPEQLSNRRRLAMRYAAMLASFSGIQYRAQADDGAWQFFPVLLPDSRSADRFTAETHRREMEIRRYYAPSLSQCSDARQLHACPIAEDLAGRMCCVPVYSDASDEEIDEMVAIVYHSLRASITGICA